MRVDDASTANRRSTSGRRVFNLRDLGGLRTRNGQRLRHRRLVRMDDPHLAVDQDLTDLRELGVHAVVDLRTDRELHERGTAAWQALAVRHLHHPLVPDLPSQDEWPRYIDPAFVAEVYARMLEDSCPVQPALWRALVEALEMKDGAVAFHCASGRDRTGVVAALLLETLGVSRADVLADYAASASGMRQMLDWLDAERPDAAPQGAYRDAFAVTPPENLALWLELLEARYGSARGYLLQAGVAPEDLARLQELLLEPDTA